MTRTGPCCTPGADAPGSPADDEGTAMTKDERLAAARARFDETVRMLRQRLGESAVATSEFRDNFRVLVDGERAYEVLEALKADGFDMLAELGGADYR